MKNIYLLFLFSFVKGVSAQTFDVERYMVQVTKSFGQHEAQAQQQFDTYRDKVNAEYAEYMRWAWLEYKAQPAERFRRGPNRRNPW